jgi:hypothetical protein
MAFDRKDHLDRVPQPGAYPLVVAPFLGPSESTRFLWTGEQDQRALHVNT